MSERTTATLPSADRRFIALITCCAPGGPTGITMIPSGVSCCNSGGGMWSMPQVTMILSKGANSSQPRFVSTSKRYLGIFLYLYVVFALFNMHEYIVLKQHQIEFTHLGFGSEEEGLVRPMV